MSAFSEEIYVVRPKEAIEFIASYVVRYPLNEGATRLLVGPPGIGKSDTTIEGFELAAQAIALANVLKSENLNCDPSALSIADIERGTDSYFTHLARSSIPSVVSALSTRSPFNSMNLDWNHVTDLAIKKWKNAVLECLKNEWCRDTATSICRVPKLAEIIDKVPIAAVKSAIFDVLSNKENPNTMHIEYDAIVEQLEVYKDSFLVVKLIVSIHEPSDLLGIPFIGNASRSTVHLPVHWALALRDSAMGLLVLDEFTNDMDPLLLNALYEITLKKRVGNIYFNKPVVATGNDADSSYLVRELPGPLLTGRIATLYFEPPTVREWIAYMNKKYNYEWFMAPAFYLLLFSKKGLIAEAIDRVAGGKENIQSDINKIIQSLFNGIDPFITGEERIKALSSVLISKERIRGNAEASFPTPRAWDYLLRELYVMKSLGIDDEKEVKRLVKAYLGLNELANYIAYLYKDNIMSALMTLLMGQKPKNISRHIYNILGLSGGNKSIININVNWIKSLLEKWLDKLIDALLKMITNNKGVEKEEFLNALSNLSILITSVALGTVFLKQCKRGIEVQLDPEERNVLEKFVCATLGALKEMDVSTKNYPNGKKIWMSIFLTALTTMLREVLFTECEVMRLTLEEEVGERVDDHNLIQKLYDFVCTSQQLTESKFWEEGE